MARGRQTMRKGWRPLVAIAASYLLVLQLMLAGLAVFGHAAPAQADGLASVICTPDGLQQASHDPAPPAGQHAAACCLMGCIGAGTASAPPPAAIAAVVASAPSEASRPAPPAPLLAGIRHSPSRARAPPSTA